MAETVNRPDYCHYVVDTVPDFIHVTNQATGVINKILAVQIWCDPLFPEAYKDVKLNDLLIKLNKKQLIVAIIRFDENSDTYVIVPPNNFLNTSDEWEIIYSPCKETEHSLEEIAEVVKNSNLKESLI